MGREYDLLSKNCNHFTSELCYELTGRRAPGWLNRAAGVGVKFPCVVPKEWIGVPEAEDEETDSEAEEAEPTTADAGAGNPDAAPASDEPAAP